MFDCLVSLDREKKKKKKEKEKKKRHLLPISLPAACVRVCVYFNRVS